MKHKVVIIYPNFPLSEVKDFNVPLNVLQLAGFLKSNNFEVKIIDTIIEKDYSHLIKKEIKDALCVGISAMTAQIPHAIEIIKEIKAENRELPIVLGGVHPTLFAKQTVQNKLIDYVVMREGEIPFLNLLNSLLNKNNERLADIPGIALKLRNGDIKENVYTERFSYSDLPKMDYSLLNPKVMENYLNSDTIYFPLLTARGCPHRCAFCINVIISEYRLYKTWTPERTVLELEQIINLPKKSIHRINFFDENFFVDRKRVEKILDLTENKNLKFEWYCAARVDYFREGFLDKPFLKRARGLGFVRLSLGVEVGSQKILDYLKKDITIENILRAAEYCEAVNVRPGYNVMIGLPNEGSEDIRGTINLLRQLSYKHKSWSVIGPQLFRPFPGSILYQDCLRAGLYEPKTIEEWVEKVEEDNRILDARNNPWIKFPKLVNVVHFYGVIIALSFLKLTSMFNEYCTMTKRNAIFRAFGLMGMLALSFIGKLRYRLNFFDFFIEKAAFDKMRRRHLSF